MFGTMQVYQASLGPNDRPCPGSDCAQCKGCAILHKHGIFTRWRGVDGACSELVQRYICPRCRRTWSVIPQGMMPYRSIEVERFEELADSQLSLPGLFIFRRNLLQQGRVKSYKTLSRHWFVGLKFSGQLAQR